MADRSILALARAHLVNPIVRAVLCSRAHRLLSGNLLLLDYTDRRTGHRYVLPVGYAPASAGGDLIVVVGQHATKHGGATSTPNRSRSQCSCLGTLRRQAPGC